MSSGRLALVGAVARPGKGIHDAGLTILGSGLAALAVALTSLPATGAIGSRRAHCARRAHQPNAAAVMAGLWHISRQWPHFDGGARGRGVRSNEAPRPHCWPRFAGCARQRRHARHHRSDAYVDRRNQAASQSADAPHAAVQASTLCRREGHCRNSRGNGALEDLASSSNSSRHPRAVRHRHRRCRLYRQLRLGRV